MSEQQTQTPQPVRSADRIRRVERRAKWGAWAGSRTEPERWNGVDRP
jgi:hypothetical protein